MLQSPDWFNWKIEENILRTSDLKRLKLKVGL